LSASGQHWEEAKMSQSGKHLVSAAEKEKAGPAKH